jgi:lipid-A-disaccharide synthase
LKKILFVTGELSGDIHAASVAGEMLRRGKDVDVTAVGGPNFRKLKVPLLGDIKDLAVVGLWEVLKHYRKIKQSFDRIVSWTEQNKPEVAVLVDYPGFNLRLAPLIKKHCKKLVYYISPQVWAWKYGRIRTIRKWFDEIIVILPFEKELYRKEHVPVQYFGHPLAYKISHFPFQKRKSEKINRVLFMPGSRTAEVMNLMPLVNSLITRWQNRPTLEFRIACADTIDPVNLRKKIDPGIRDDVEIRQGNTYQLLDWADIVIAASGTASLEATLFHKPVVVVYRIHWLSMLFFRLLSKVRFISLTNIILEGEVLKEFLASRLPVDKIALEAEKLLDDKDARLKMVKELQKVGQWLYKGNSYALTAAHLLKLMKKL